MNLDLYIFNLINRPAGRRSWLDFLAVFCAKYLGYLLIAILFLAAYFRGSLVILLVPLATGIFSRFVINELIYLFYKRKRPVEVLNIKAIVDKPRYPSFPSGHTSFFFAISFALWPFSFHLCLLFLIFSLLISLARIFGGVHWPSDILAGMSAAAISAFIINLFLHFK